MKRRTSFKDIPDEERGKVKEAQQLLVDAGLAKEKLPNGKPFADGKFGGATEDIVKLAQEKNGLPETGIIDSQTLALLKDLKANKETVQLAQASPQSFEETGIVQTTNISQAKDQAKNNHAGSATSGELIASKQQSIEEHRYRSGEARPSVVYGIGVTEEHSIKVIIPEESEYGIPAENYASALSRDLSGIPAHILAATKEIACDPGRNCDDKYWQKKYGNGNGFVVSAASGGNGQITGYGGGMILPDDLRHEVAHNWKQAHPNLDWSAIAKLDGNSISAYGNTNGDEDFSESFAEYARLKTGNHTNELRKFEEKYPNRANTLAKIWDNPTDSELS